MQPIIKGMLYKLSTILKMPKLRYFVLDPNDGKLYRYKK